MHTETRSSVRKSQSLASRALQGAGRLGWAQVACGKAPAGAADLTPWGPSDMGSPSTGLAAPVTANSTPFFHFGSDTSAEPLPRHLAPDDGPHVNQARISPPSPIGRCRLAPRLVWEWAWPAAQPPRSPHSAGPGGLKGVTQGLLCFLRTAARGHFLQTQETLGCLPRTEGSRP